MSVLVITEQLDGQWHRMSWEALAAGREIATALNVPLAAAVVGANLDGAAGELAQRNLDRVSVVDHELLAAYTPDGYSAALRQLIEKEEPRLVLLPHTYQVRDFAPKLAASLGRPLLSDVIAMRQEGGELLFVRQLFQGKLQADVAAADEPPHFASLQAGAWRADETMAGEAATIEKIAVTIEPAQIRVKPGERFREAKGDVDLSSAPIIVSVGRGIQEEEHISIVRELADALGAELGASRPICDNGWLPLERQVGSSGQTVAPKLYIAVGISGAIQHVVGMKGAQKVVAINKDRGAPIFEVADYGIVGDLFEVVPALTKALKEDAG